MVKIIAIGKKNEYQNKINDYSKRLSKQFEVS
jgi:23S rRNA pseudoU1915 N3-methylase RlmH